MTFSREEFNARMDAERERDRADRERERVEDEKERARLQAWAHELAAQIRAEVMESLAPIFKAIDARFEHLEQRMDNFEARMDRFEARLDKFEARLDRLPWWFASHLLGMILAIFGSVWGVVQVTAMSMQAGASDQRAQQTLQEQVLALRTGADSGEAKMEARLRTSTSEVRAVEGRVSDLDARLRSTATAADTQAQFRQVHRKLDQLAEAVARSQTAAPAPPREALPPQKAEEPSE